MRITHKDFRYDVRAWHEYLMETDAGGYKWSNKHRGYLKAIEHALEDEEWHACVAEAESTNLCQLLIDQDARQREAVDLGEREWAEKPRNCPKCSTSFVSVHDRGQCPRCSVIFYASHPEAENKMWWLEID